MGAAFLAGGLRHPVQTFGTMGARTQIGMMALAALAILVPSIIAVVGGGKFVAQSVNFSIAVSVILLPLRPFWSLGLFLSAYAIMFFGHFVFERNIPTIFKKPATPIVIAFSVIRGFWVGVARRAATPRVRS